MGDFVISDLNFQKVNGWSCAARDGGLTKTHPTLPSCGAHDHCRALTSRAAPALYYLFDCKIRDFICETDNENK